jgi:hypothetical protein
MFYIQHCFIRRPLSWIPPCWRMIAWIEPRTVATLAMAVRRFNHSSRSNPQTSGSHPVNKLKMRLIRNTEFENNFDLKIAIPKTIYPEDIYTKRG